MYDQSPGACCGEFRLIMPNQASSQYAGSRLWVRYPVKKDRIVLVALLLLATLLRFHRLNEPGLWLDEVSYTTFAQSPIMDQILNPEVTLNRSFDPVLSAIPFSLSLKLGFSNFLARFPAAVFGILSVAVIYRLGRTLLGNAVGLIAALLLCTSNYHLLYSQEARSYSQLVFFSLASFWFFYQALDKNRVRFWIPYAIFTWAGLSSHYVMALVIAIQAGFLAIVYVQQRLLIDFNQEPGLVSRKKLAYFALSQVTILLLRAPWFGNSVTRLGNTEGGSHALDLTNSSLRSLNALAGGSTSLLVLTGVGLIFALYYSRRSGPLLAGWLILAIPITKIGLWIAGQLFNERHTIWGLSAILLVASAGAVGVGFFAQKILPTTRQKNSRLVRLALSSVLVVPIVFTFVQQSQHNIALKQTWPRGMLQEATDKIIRESHDGETIISIGVPAKHLRFYLDRFRQELTVLDENVFIEKASASELPTQLNGRWYVFNNAYSRPDIPDRWNQSVDYGVFHDIVVIHIPETCALPDCLDDIITFLTEISDKNPGSFLAKRVDGILAGLKYTGVR
jgi:mannosyltransferase